LCRFWRWQIAQSQQQPSFSIVDVSTFTNADKRRFLVNIFKSGVEFID
jgi:hypothetical protein